MDMEARALGAAEKVEWAGAKWVRGRECGRR